jgi:hypothetical protein
VITVCERPARRASIRTASRSPAGLPSTVAVDDDDRVRADDRPRLARAAAITAGLAAAQTFGVLARALSARYRLVDVGRLHLVRDADEVQQLAPARRLRRRGSRGAALIVPGRSVTGPSFTRSDVHHGAELARLDAVDALAQHRDEALVQRDRRLGSRLRR